MSEHLFGWVWEKIILLCSIIYIIRLMRHVTIIDVTHVLRFFDTHPLVTLFSNKTFVISTQNPWPLSLEMCRLLWSPLSLFQDHEGKEFHHYDYFCQLYRAEIVSLNRTLDLLMRQGILPTTYHISSIPSSFPVFTVLKINKMSQK